MVAAPNIYAGGGRKGHKWGKKLKLAVYKKLEILKVK